jgi:hypothetical protein
VNAAVGSQPIELSGIEGGVRVEVYDESRPYGYSNRYQVVLRIVARFPGGGDPYETVLTRTSVQDAALQDVKDAVVADFRASALPCLLRPDFPARLAAHRQREQRKVLQFPEVS